MKNYDLITQFDSLIERVLPGEQPLAETLSNMVLDQNSEISEIRQVSLDTVKAVAARSLTASLSLAPEVRYFTAIRDVTNFLSLATEGSRPNGSVFNTDLLPVGHPDSTKEHNLGPTSFRARRGDWYAADPRIESDYVRGLVASAFSANPRTARYTHAMARLHALPTAEIPRDLLLNPLTAGIGHAIGNAIKDAIFKGKNSSFWRSLRAKAQLRDEKGRFEYMGGGLNAHVRFPDGNVYEISGKMAGNSTTDGDVEMELKGVKGLRDGIYDIPANKTTASKALLPATALDKLKRTLVPENAFRNDIIDIRDLVAKETPDGWARSNFEEATPGVDHAPTPDETFTSGDGYNVALYNRSTPALEQYIEQSKGLYDVTTIGSDGTGELTPGEPVYAVIGSKRGDSEVIGFTNDWASVQKIVSDEDKSHPTTENESLTPEEQPVKPKAILPAKANLMEEPDEEEEGPINPDDGMPDTWEKLGDNKYASKDGRFNVDYIFGPSGTKYVYDEDSGEFYYEDQGDSVGQYRIKDNKGEAPDDISFRNWDQISTYANRAHQNDIDLLQDSNLLPEFKTPEEDEYYHSLDPLEKLAYNNFGEDSGAVFQAETFIDDYMERLHPGSHTYEHYNNNGFWFNDFVGANSNISENEDGTYSASITKDRTGEVLAQSDKIDPNETNEWLNYELARLFPVPDDIKKFDFNKERKEYNSTSGKNASSFADGIDSILSHMYNNGYGDINSKSYSRYMDEIGDLADAIRYQTPGNQSKSNLMEEKVKNTEEARPLTRGQGKLLWGKYYEASKTVKVSEDIRKRIEEINANPSAYTTDDLGDIVKSLAKQAAEGNKPDAGNSIGRMWAAYFNTPRVSVETYKRISEIAKNPKEHTAEDVNNVISQLEKDATNEAIPLMVPNVTPAQKKFIDDLMKSKQLTPERRTELLEKLNGINGQGFDKGEATQVIGELKSAPGIDLSNPAPGGEVPKYLTGTVPVGSFGPSNEQLVYLEALIENREIPEDVLKEFMDTYQHMMMFGGADDYINLFQNYPFKEQYRPKYLYTNLGEEGASDRQLASFERIFGKGLVSDEEMAELKRIIPNMYRNQVSNYLLPLKDMEDKYDIDQIERAIAEGRSTEGMLIPTGWEVPKDRPDLKEAEETTALDDKAGQTEDAIHEARRKRRKEARNLKRSIGRLINYFNKERDSNKDLRAAGRKIIDGAVADLIDLHTAIDMRRAYPISAENVDKRLQHVIDGMNPNTNAYSYGKTTNEASRRAVENLSSSVHDIIGDYSGYSPDLADHYGDSATLDNLGGNDPVVTEIENAKDNEESVLPNDEPIVPHPGGKPSVRRLSPKSFQGPALEPLKDAKDWQEVKDFFNNNTHYIVDTETTGLADRETPEIKNDATQVTAHKVVNGKIVDTLNTYINPQSPISDWVKQNVPNGQGGFVDEAFLADKPTAEQVVPELKKFLGDNPIVVGHNFAGFDADVLERLYDKAGEKFTPGGIVDTLGLADHAMHDWSANDPRGPFEQKMKYDRNLGHEVMSMTKSKGLNAIAAYYKARNVEGLQSEGAHSSLVDTHNNHVIFNAILDDAIKGDVKDGAKNFDYDAASNDYDKLLPGYQSRYKAYEERLDQWLTNKAKYDAQRKNSPEGQLEEELKKLRDNRNAPQTPSKDGTVEEGSSLATTSAPVPDVIDPVTTSLVQPDPENGIRPPSPKQLASVERRLQMEGVVDPVRAQQIWEALPHLTNKDIGDVVQEMDIAELRHRMKNNLPILDLTQKRIPPQISDEVLDYLRNGPDAEKLGPTNPNLLEETVRPDTTLLKAIYAKNVLQRALESDKSNVDEDDIVSSIHALDKAIEKLTPQANLMSETVDPHPNKYDPADLDKIQLDLGFLPITPTEEGERIIKAIHKGDDVVVLALAGTGKTTTLESSAQTIKKYYPNKKILYIVFNNEMAKEARLRMPDNVEVRTMDSISYGAVVNSQLKAKIKGMGKQYEEHNKPVSGYIDISRYLGVPAEIQLKNAKNISGATATSIALNGLNKWCLSDDREMDRKHFSMGDKIGEENYVPEIMDIAKKIWKNLLTKHDNKMRQIRPSFTHMMKNFALNNPDLSDANENGLAAKPDYIFVDEAQDTNRVFYRVIQDQKDLHKNGISITAVGDPNQAIYGWRGAVDALNLYDRDVTLPLTLMFRSGKEIAEVGNMVLDIKNTGKERLRGNPAKTSSILAPGSMTDADAVIVRSNAGGLEEILTLLEREQTPGVPRTFKEDLTSYIASLKWLYGVGGSSKYNDKPKKLHEAVLPYEGGTWADMLKAVEENPDPNITKFFSIKNRMEGRLTAQGRGAGMYDIFKEIEKAVNGSRIYGVKGFKAPEDGNWGTEGDLGNVISYKIKDKVLRIFNTGNANIRSITDPNHGTSNNTAILKALGFKCDVKGTWDWMKDVNGSGKEELDQLYNALSGNDIDTVIMTGHRSKGLEFPNVKIGSDWKGPDEEKDAASIAMGQLPGYLDDEELNDAYVAITRAMASLDLGSLAWISEDTESAKSARSEALKAADKMAPPSNLMEEQIDAKSNEMTQVLNAPNPEAIKDTYHGMAAFTAGPDLASSTSNLMSETPPKDNPKVNQKAVDELIKRIIAAMDEGVIPWKKPWDGSGNYLPTSGATGKNYKGINLFTLMLFAQMNGWTGTRWYTKNAIAKLGGHVDPEDGVGIIKVTKYEYKVKPIDGLKVKDPKTGEQKDDDGTRIGTGIRGDVVYNEDVIKGITLPPATKLKEAPPTHEVEQILLDSYADHPEIVHVPQDAAFYRPDTDKIYLPLREQFHSTEEYLDTLFHELTHSTADPKRLDRKSDLDLDKYGTHKDVRAREELVAEMGSAILSSIFGVNTDIKNVAAYVQSWKKFLENEPQALYEAASLSSKAVEHMLKGWNGHLDEEEEGEYEQPEAINMPAGDITGEDGTSGGLGNGVNYRIEGNRIYLMGDTFNKKDIIKSLSITPEGMSKPFSFFWDKTANNWSISLKDPAQRVQILNDLKAKLG